LNPFAGWGAHRPCQREQHLAGQLAERDTQLAERDAWLVAADQLVGQLVLERDWFHQHWLEDGNRAYEAECVVGHLEAQLDEERAKVTALEQIAGPYTDSADTPSPIFNEVTQEIRIPVTGLVGPPVPAITVRSLAAAFSRTT
jgi:hypothetical protein